METLEREPAAQSAPRQHLADADITTAIETLYRSKGGVNAHFIDVATHEGVVVLTGFTDSLLARQRAEEVALAVRDVRGVVNELAIRTPELSDAELRRDVERALAHDAATAEYNVACTVTNGRVTVLGTVRGWLEKQLVLRVLRGVRGVCEVVAGQLTVGDAPRVSSDEEMTTELREILDWDIRVNAALVEVATTDHVVRLTGTVGSAAEKAHLVDLAYQAGASRVEAQSLLVAPWALVGELRRDKFAHRPDEAVAQAVRDTLARDPRIRATEPKVQVLSGHVTLRGAVSDLRTRLDAEQDARHVVGVWDVQNLLKVRPPYLLPDTDIRQFVEQALARDPYVGGLDLRVRVCNGKVLLTGKVGNHFEREQAADVAAGLSGVAEVENRIQVTGATCPTGLRPVGPGGAPGLAAHPSPDHVLAARIRQRHHWAADFFHHDVSVRVESGVVTLTGTVDTWVDRAQAAREASEAGAQYVNNELRVRTGKRV